jgi:N-acylneuraminate cytidylyltransferase
MILAVIPARLNSKRIFKKNIKSFWGHPIISYSIKTAKNSKIFDKIIVSTDSEEIGRISEKYGAEFLFKRPKFLSNDYIWPNEVVKHSINWIEKNFSKPKFICCIFATAPLMLSKDLINSYKLIKTNKYSNVFSAVKNTYPIQRSFFLNKQEKIQMINNRNFYKRSQDFPETYHDAGQFHWGTYESWINNKTNFNKKSKFYLLPKLRVQDIDTSEDFKIAKQLYKLL